MIRVPQAEQQVAPRAIQGTSDEFRRMDLSDAFGAVGAELLVQGGDALGKMAEREDQLLRKETELQMLTDLAAFDVENEARVQEIAQQSPGRGLTQRVMNDFNERKQVLLDAQPNYLKAEAQTRLLPVQVRQAKAAIGTENAQIRAQAEARARAFRDTVVNNVAFGRVGIEDTEQSIAEYVSRLPAGQQENARLELTSAAYKAHILNQMGQNPSQVVEDIKAGVYDSKVEASALLSLYGQGRKAQAELATQTNKLRDKALSLRTKDPAEAAISLLRANGVETPSEQQIIDIQTTPIEQGGLGRGKAFSVTKSQADELMLQLQDQPSAESAAQYLNEVKAQMVREGIDPADRFSQIVQLSDASPKVKMALTMDMDNVTPEFQAAWFSAIKDKDAVTNAGKLLRANFTEVDIAKVLEPAREQRLKIQSVLAANPAEALNQSQAFYDVAVVAAASMIGATSESRWFSGPSANADNLKKRMEEITSTYSLQELRQDGNDAYVLPKMIAPSVSESVLKNARKEVIQSDLFEFIPDFFDEELQKDDYLDNVGWTMAGSDALRLTYRMQDITYRGTNIPIELTYSDLYDIVSDAQGNVKTQDIVDRLKLKQRATPIPRGVE